MFYVLIDILKLQKIIIDHNLILFDCHSIYRVYELCGNSEEWYLAWIGRKLVKVYNYEECKMRVDLGGIFW